MCIFSRHANANANANTNADANAQAHNHHTRSIVSSKSQKSLHMPEYPSSPCRTQFAV